MFKTIINIKNALLAGYVFFSIPATAETSVLSASQSINDAQPFSVSNVLQMMAGLAFVILLILLLGWVYRRFGTPRTIANGDFRIVAGLSMGQRERLVMLEVGGCQILLGVGPGRVEKIHVFEEPVIQSSQAGQNDGFAARLSSVINQRGQS